MKTARSINSNIVLLTITHFLWGFVNFVYMIQIQPLLLSIYGTSYEAAQILGLILSIGTFSAVLPLLMGFFADTYGRKKLIIFGELLSIVGMIGLSIEPTQMIIIIPSIIVFNLGIGFYDPPFQGLVYESSRKKRGLAYSAVYNSSYIAGIIASIYIQIEGNTNFAGLFQIGLILIIGAVLINLLGLRDIRPNNKKINFPLLKTLKDPKSRITAIVFATDAFIWGLPLSIANGIYIIMFGVDVTFIAMLSFIETVVLVILQYPAGAVVDRFGRLTGLILGEVIGYLWIILILAAMTIPDSALELLIIAYAVLGAVVAFWRPAVTLSFISIDPSAASTNFGLLSFFQRMGRVPAAAVAGVLFSIVGFPPLLIVTFVGTLVIIGMFFKIDKLEKANLLEK